MKEYDFILKFDLRDSECDPSIYVEDLMGSGCDDALIGIGKKGYIALDFTRESDSAEQAISSAISDIRSVIPHAALVESAPDLVGLSEIADFMGFTRQNARKLLVDNTDSVPVASHHGSSTLWRLSEVLAWFKQKGYEVSPELLEVATFNMQLNVVKDMKKVDKPRQEQLAPLVA